MRIMLLTLSFVSVSWTINTAAKVKVTSVNQPEALNSNADFQLFQNGNAGLQFTPVNQEFSACVPHFSTRLRVTDPDPGDNVMYTIVSGSASAMDYLMDTGTGLLKSFRSAFLFEVFSSNYSLFDISLTCSNQKPFALYRTGIGSAPLESR